jgi:hypothetical protein
MDAHPLQTPRNYYTSLAIMPHVLRFEASRCPRAKPVKPVSEPVRPISICLLCQVFGLGFVAQPSNSVVLWWTATNPAYLVQIHANCHSRLGCHGRAGSVFTLSLNQGSIHDFILLFLPPCGLHLIPSVTGSLERSLFVSPHLKSH